MKLQRLLALIEEILPSGSAAQDDVIGLQIQAACDDVHRLLVAYEITDEVISEAVSANIDYILTFHPLIYSPLQAVADSDRVGRMTRALIAAGIGVVVVHTNLDSHPNGTNAIIANKLGAETIGFLRPSDMMGYGMGIVAKFHRPIEQKAFLEKIASTFSADVRWSAPKNSCYSIQTVGIVAGSGFSYINDVVDKKLDAFLTADVKYHQFHYAKEYLLIADVGHSEMEQWVPQTLMQLLDAALRMQGAIAIISKVKTSPMQYCRYISE